MAKTLKIRGGQVRSINALKRSVKRGAAGGTIQWIKGDAPRTVRFIEEPDRWFEFYQHYDERKKTGGICIGDECKFCADDIRASKRHLANVVDTDDSRVIALALPSTVVNLLLKFYDKYGTLIDRDYELSREGEGKSTEYSAVPEGKTKFNHSAYEPLDLGAILIAEAGGEEDEDSDDEADEDFLPPKKRAGSRTSPGTSQAKPRDSAEPEEDEDDEEEDAPPPRKRTLPKKTVKPPVKTVRKVLRK